MDSGTNATSADTISEWGFLSGLTVETNSFQMLEDSSFEDMVKRGNGLDDSAALPSDSSGFTGGALQTPGSDGLQSGTQLNESFQSVNFGNALEMELFAIQNGQESEAAPGSEQDVKEDLGAESVPVRPEFLQKPGPEFNCDQTNLDACISTALMSLPAFAPKPIWEEGVWAAIFGNGILMQMDFCQLELHKPAVTSCLDEWLGQMSECSRTLKRSIHDSTGETFEEVVKHVTEQTWEEERESLLQSALKRWMVVALAFKQSTLVWAQLAAQSKDVEKVMVLGDIFRGKAPATLLKRVRAVEKFCNFFGPGGFPCSEESIYRFFQRERADGAPPSRLKSFMGAQSQSLQ